MLGLLPWGVARLRAAFLGPRTCRAAAPYVTRTPAAVITACVPRQGEITQTGNLFLCLVGAAIFSVDSGRADSLRAPATARKETYRRFLFASVLLDTSKHSSASKKAGAVRQIRSSSLYVRGRCTCVIAADTQTPSLRSVQRTKSPQELSAAPQTKRWTPSAAASHRR